MVDAATHLADLQARRRAHVMDTYGDPPLAFVRGEGSALFDGEGRAYLDFLTGLAVTSLGHANPEVAGAASEQLRTLVHTSNLYLTEPAIGLAEDLARITGWDDARCFFAQCGATANEAALKLARRHGKQQHPDKIRVVTLEGSFHGRSFATLEATGQPAKHEPFAPLLGVVDTVAHDDADALRAAVTDEHCAVLLEVVQGEGGVRRVPDDVLLAARQACDEHGALLIVDEVQTGIGRTGQWFAHQGTPVRPDVITVAKALANGLPLGAVVARGSAASVFQPGDHATTFGGNPVTCAAARKVIEIIERDHLLERVTSAATRLRERILGIGDARVSGVRGEGLLLAVELAAPIAKELELECRDRFLLTNAVRPDALRLAPPLTVADDEVDLAVTIFADALTAIPTADDDKGTP